MTMQAHRRAVSTMCAALRCPTNASPFWEVITRRAQVDAVTEIGIPWIGTTGANTKIIENGKSPNYMFRVSMDMTAQVIRIRGSGADTVVLFALDREGNQILRSMDNYKPTIVSAWGLVGNLGGIAGPLGAVNWRWLYWHRSCRSPEQSYRARRIVQDPVRDFDNHLCCPLSQRGHRMQSELCLLCPEGGHSITAHYANYG
jgi:hypothetical protein